MSRKDFTAIAAEIKSEFDEWDDRSGSAKVAIIGVAERIADVCATSNPNFDRARFLAACGVAGGDK